MKKQPGATVADMLQAKAPGAATIKPTESVAMLARRLQQERLGAMIVSSDGHTVDGIISERDVAYSLALHRGGLHALPVSALMTKNVVTCCPQDSLPAVARVMAERHIRHLPVVEGAAGDAASEQLHQRQRVAGPTPSTYIVGITRP